MSIVVKLDATFLFFAYSCYPSLTLSCFWSVSSSADSDQQGTEGFFGTDLTDSLNREELKEASDA